MDDQQLLRYSRQIMLPQVDIAGQQRLTESTVLVVGLGGLGSPIAMYLASAGVGSLIISDDDVVDLSNLQRQLLHTTHDIEAKKTESARDKLLALNPDTNIVSIDTRLTPPQLRQRAEQADVIIDATDNFETRFLLNQISVEQKTPLVSGAAIRMEGQVSVFDPRLISSPCYRCLYKDEDELAERCSETGVLSPVVGIIGSIQATEAMKLLMGIGEPLVGRLLIIDALSMEIRTLRLKKDSHCPVCAHQ